MSTIRTNAILDASGGNTATINGIPLRQGVLDPENRIINGAFDFWQRGTSTSAGGFAADRWRNTFSSGTVTQAQVAFAVGDTLGVNNPKYFLRQTVSGQSLASANARTIQYIEGVRSYAGQTITVLGWARRSSGSGNMAISSNQYFGTGGSPSATVEVAGQQVALTTSWEPFAAVTTLPSIAGKTIGTAGDDYLTLTFWSSAGSDYDARTASLGVQTIGVDLWGIHIKVGTHTTAAVNLYKQPEPALEFPRCLRYYTNGTFSDNGGSGHKYMNAGSTVMFSSSISFGAPMRVAPTMTIDTAPTYTNGSAIEFSGTTQFGTGTRMTVTAAGIYRAFSGAWSADAELV